MTTFKLGPKSKPAELLAALGERLGTYQDHDYLYLPRYSRLVLHDTARRDYICGCGSRLITRNINGRWMTVCEHSPNEHEQGQFMSQAAFQRMLQDELVQKASLHRHNRR